MKLTGDGVGNTDGYAVGSLSGYGYYYRLSRSECAHTTARCHTPYHVDPSISQL